MGFDAQRFVEGDGLDIFNGHFGSDGHNFVEFAEYAHSVIEDGGDDAAVAVSGRPGVTFAEAEAAHEALPFLNEFQAHALGIVASAGETEVLLSCSQGEGFRGVSFGERVLGHIFWHEGCIVPDRCGI